MTSEDDFTVKYQYTKLRTLEFMLAVPDIYDTISDELRAFLIERIKQLKASQLIDPKGDY